MKHQFYKKPTITIVQLRQQCHILAGSELSNTAGLRNYQKQVYEEEE